MTIEATKTYTAEFTLVRHAKAFELRITEPGWYATNVKRTGKTVTFDGPATHDYFIDMLGTVGYFGAAFTGRIKATLNGVRAPAEM